MFNEKTKYPEIDSCLAKAGYTGNCSGCPAFEWISHQDGIHPCALGFEIVEKNEEAHPVSLCIRPMTIGASYLIAKALNRPEPMVGKPDRNTFEQFCDGKNKPEQ